MKLKLCSLVCVLLASTPVTWAKDPFTPPQKLQLFYQLIYQTGDDGLPTYKMFMMRDGAGYALLNDTFVKVGDSYDDMKVEKINDKGVVLETPYGEQKIIVLEGLQGDLSKLRQAVKEGNK